MPSTASAASAKRSKAMRAQQQQQQPSLMNRAEYAAAVAHLQNAGMNSAAIRNLLGGDVRSESRSPSMTPSGSMTPLRLPSPDPAPVIAVKKKKKTKKADDAPPVVAHCRVAKSATPPSRSPPTIVVKKKQQPPPKAVKVCRQVASDASMASEGPACDPESERVCGQIENGFRSVNRRLELMEVRLDTLVEDTRQYQNLMMSILDRVVRTSSGTERALQCVMGVAASMSQGHAPNVPSNAMVPGAWARHRHGVEEEEDDDDDEDTQMPGFGRMRGMP